MRRLEHVLVWAFGWALAVLAGETVGLLLAAALRVMSPTVGWAVGVFMVGVALFVAPFAADWIFAQYKRGRWTRKESS